VKKTKARQLLQIAYATYQRDEPEIAKDIFVLAMEDPTAAVEFSGSRQDLLSKFDQAVAAGDYDEAADQLEALEDMGEEDEGEFIPEMDDTEEEEEEAALSPGDFVEPPPPPDLAPAQVASLVTLARRIRQDGHPDLARRITRALGL
jgi:hypothetical protein